MSRTRKRKLDKKTVETQREAVKQLNRTATKVIDTAEKAANHIKEEVSKPHKPNDTNYNTYEVKNRTAGALSTKSGERRGSAKETFTSYQKKTLNQKKDKVENTIKDTANKVASTVKRATTVEGSGKDYAKHGSNVNGNIMSPEQLDTQKRGLSTTAGGKFISNMYDSILDNSPVGAVATLATGKRPSNYFNQNNPYNDTRTQGISAGAGRMAGMALNYGLARSAFNPMLDRATNAVLNGTRLGSAIKSSATLGKIGQKTGELGAEIGRGLIKETISDATLGFGQNALINYGEGLRGEDFWKQQAKDTALDFLVGGTMEGLGIAGRQAAHNKALRREAQALQNDLNTSLSDKLRAAKSKSEYLDELKAKTGLFETADSVERATPEMKAAAKERAAEYLEEINKVDAMSDSQFKSYRLRNNPDAIEATRPTTAIKNNSFSLARKGEAVNGATESVAEQRGLERRVQRNRRAAIETSPESAQERLLNEATSKDDYLDKLAREVTQNSRQLPTAGKQRLRNGANINASFQKKSDDLVEEMAKVAGMSDDEFMAYKKGVPVSTDNGTYSVSMTNGPTATETSANLKETADASVKKTQKSAKSKKTRTPSDRMSYKTLLALPDSEEKWLALSKKFERDLESENAGGASTGKEVSTYIADPEGFEKATPEYLRMRNERLKASKVDSPDDSVYNIVKGEQIDGRENTQPLQEGNIQQGAEAGNSGSKGILQGESGRTGRLGVVSEAGDGANSPVRVYEGDIVDKKTNDVLLTDKGIPRRTAKTADNAENFAKKVDDNRANNKYGCCVSPIDLDEYDGSAKYFTTHDGQVTCGVLSDGNVVALSKSANAPKDVTSHEALMTAIGMGGDRCDAYGLKLARKYQRYGFVPVARVKFDENVVREYFRPEEVESSLKTFKEMRDMGNEPDVFFFAKFDDLENTIKTRKNGGYKMLTDEELESLPVMDYDKANDFRNELLDNADKRKAFMDDHAVGVKNSADTYSVKNNAGGDATITRTNGEGTQDTSKQIKSLSKKKSASASQAEAPQKELPQNGAKGKNSKKPKKLSNKREKVGVFETEGSSIKTSVYEPHNEGKIGAFRRAYNSIFNNASHIERMGKATKDGGKLASDVTAMRNARGQAAYMVRHGAIDMNGNKVGKSLAEIFEPIQKDKAAMKAYGEYVYDLHNIDRAAQGKGIWGDTVSADESRKRIEKLFDEHKEYKETFENIQKELNAFNDNLRQWLVDSGAIDKETAKAWKKLYPNYVPTFRNMGAAGGVGNNPKGLGAVLHKAKGDANLDLLPIEDQLAGQVERIVTAARNNALKADMIKLFADNPNAKAYGAVISNKSAKEVFGDINKFVNDGNVDYDGLVDAISKNAAEQIQGGKNTISAFIDGRKVTAHVSNELYQSIKAIENAGNSDLITRAGKWITNPMKFTITGGNPVFTISNMLRDLPTLYIQSKHSMLRTTVGLAKAFKEVVTNGDIYNMYRALGGGEAGYYVRGKGFETSLSNKNFWDKAKEILSVVGEKGETIPRLAEFINTYEKTGNAKLALRDAAESTVDFSRHGSSDVVRALDAWTLYLNAGMQGLDKFARTVAEHPVRTAYRSAALISVPFTVLTAINWDNPHFQDLSERTKQNNFCIPNYAGEKDEEGRPMTFVKVPLNREYGTILGASLDCIFRAFGGEDDAFKGFGETVKTNFLPNNPITDNVLAPLYFNIPENKDFAGRAIISNSLKDAPAKDQYDYGTSGFAKGVSTVANKVMGDHDFGILGYLKSPMLVDYLMDSYTGYYGDVAQTATSQAKDKKELAESTLVDPFVKKFSGDARYSSKPVADAYDLLDKYTSEKKHEELNGHTSSEAHVAYKAISNIITQLTESSKAEKELLADTSLSKKERTAMINELREAKNDLARDAKKAINKAIADYRENPTFAMMQTDTQDKWNEDLKMDKETWAETYTGLQEKSKKNEDGTGGMTADEKRFYLLENGVTSYKQAQSFLGDNTSEDKWKEAKTDFKNGKTLKDAKKEAKLAKEKEEAQKNMTPQEKSFENYFKARVNERSDGKTVSKDIVDKYIKEAQYVDSNNPDKKSRNGSITQQEAYTAIETIGKRNHLSQAQKAYLWSISNDWKTNPYG